MVWLVVWRVRGRSVAPPDSSSAAIRPESASVGRVKDPRRHCAGKRMPIANSRCIDRWPIADRDPGSSPSALTRIGRSTPQRKFSAAKIAGVTSEPFGPTIERGNIEWSQVVFHARTRHERWIKVCSGHGLSCKRDWRVAGSRSGPSLAQRAQSSNIVG
jgi:hypothetical protein